MRNDDPITGPPSAPDDPGTLGTSGALPPIEQRRVRPGFTRCHNEVTGGTGDIPTATLHRRRVQGWVPIAETTDPADGGGDAPQGDQGGIERPDPPDGSTSSTTTTTDDTAPQGS